jgi:hypothetical protein
MVMYWVENEHVRAVEGSQSVGKHGTKVNYCDIRRPGQAQLKKTQNFLTVHPGVLHLGCFQNDCEVE